MWFGATNDVVGSLYTFRDGIAEYTSLKEQNRVLAEENERLLNLHRSSYASVESKYVRIQDTIFKQRYRYLNAKVVNNTTGKQNNYLTLNKGSRDGVQIDMGVVGPNGIVGKIVDVSENYSTAMSVLHGKFTATVRSARSGHKGFFKWPGQNDRSGTIVDVARHAPILEGDTFITRGTGGTFPEGTLVGLVTTVTTQDGSNYHDITVELTTDHESIGHVLIVMDLTKTERIELEERTEEDNAANGDQ